ncbi:hypothetical protein CO033_01360 [Candidatus Nomurabacteria bacterium CG_4_9_14_0_2_um_filter_32_10]|uniref:Uncharacterized protein n=1 Tax=Candidatus Nomurabacteria bacterium CG_4_9_14_0_2_um_filter_32_10 TaxID=1974729 RepID=A0A2J0N3L9_9BACT|nr:MAG: hypothetical protein CO033_01360 [Candidatus Nomurabacteria bacterium CG_4_9_14_0_2_um_filter_32_10]
MLSKKNRVDKKGIDFIFKKGNSVTSPSFMFKFVLIDEPTRPRISFIAPKNIARLAVKRNLLRRKGYYVLKKYINQFSPKILGVFVFKKIEEDILKIENEIKNILNKIN